MKIVEENFHDSTVLDSLKREVQFLRLCVLPEIWFMKMPNTKSVLKACSLSVVDPAKQEFLRNRKYLWSEVNLHQMVSP